MNSISKSRPKPPSQDRQRDRQRDRQSNRQSDVDRYNSLLNAHGARRDKLVAEETARVQQLLRKRKKATALTTLTLIVVGGSLLTPWAAPLLHERTSVGLALLFVLVALDLIWIVQIKRLFNAWTQHQDLKKLAG
jgi:hypothetical protein